MHKHLLKLTAILCMTWTLSAGCTGTSNEAAEAAKPAVSAETAEVTESIKFAKSEDCVITPPKQPVACTMQYDPVCGCDGKTYSNACMARGAGVPRSEPGACEDQLNQ